LQKQKFWQKIKMHPTTILAIFLLLAPPYARAHIPFFEPQLFDASPQSDWTMENPFIIPTDPSAGYSPSLNNSRAITSVLGLTPDDTYDVAMFEIAADSPSTPSQQIIIGLEALAPNCPADSLISSAAFYPSLALLGPSADPNFATGLDISILDTLPFPIPQNYGAIIRNQPRVSQDQRGVYSAGPFQSYLLPSPLTPDCITTEQAFSTCANGTAAQTSIITDVKLTTPGKYYIVWWDPDSMTSDNSPAVEIPPALLLASEKDGSGSSGDGSIPLPKGGMQQPGLPRQVTISFGVAEEPTEKEQVIQMEVISGKKVPAFNACTGSFIAPPVFVGAAMPPSME
jgi:hypothetical protein